MRKNLTEIVFILDRSGSMSGLAFCGARRQLVRWPTAVERR